MLSHGNIKQQGAGSLRTDPIADVKLLDSFHQICSCQKDCVNNAIQGTACQHFCDMLHCYAVHYLMVKRTYSVAFLTTLDACCFPLFSCLRLHQWYIYHGDGCYAAFFN